MTYNQLHHIFAEIHHGRGNHGSFLRAFAQAFLYADDSNALLLTPAAISLVEKYNLLPYLN